MNQVAFADDYNNLVKILKSVYVTSCDVSASLDLPFNITFDEFISPLDQALSYSYYEYVGECGINPEGYDTAKVVSFLAHHLQLSINDDSRFNCAPIYYSYFCMLQQAHGSYNIFDGCILTGFPNIKKICKNLHWLMVRYNSGAPTFTFLKGIQYTILSIRRKLEQQS